MGMIINVDGNKKVGVRFIEPAKKTGWINPTPTKNHLRKNNDKDLIIFLKKGRKFKIYVL